jgi:hypothetical protein
LRRPGSKQSRSVPTRSTSSLWRARETAGWTTVVFTAVATEPETDTDLGLADEEILDAAWFEGLPDEVFDRDRVEAVYERCELTA